MTRPEPYIKREEADLEPPPKGGATTSPRLSGGFALHRGFYAVEPQFKTHTNFSKNQTQEPNTICFIFCIAHAPKDSTGKIRKIRWELLQNSGFVFRLPDLCGGGLPGGATPRMLKAASTGCRFLFFSSSASGTPKAEARNGT